MGQQDMSVRELVDKIKRGEIRLPEMQRQYVWKKTQVRDLLDSLYRGYPSGTILTWETGNDVVTRDFAVEQDTNTQRYLLLLDGQQRLTSLSAIIRGEPLHVRDQKLPIDVLFNLEHPEGLVSNTEDDENDEEDAESGAADTSESERNKSDKHKTLAFDVSNNRLKAEPQWVSVSEVFGDSSDKKILEIAGITSMEDERFDKYSERLQKLRAIQDYQYRVNVLEHSKSYEEVTDIFVRVNSLGTKLRSSDLALAQITATWPDSLKIFQKFKEECSKKDFAVDLGIHLRNLVAFATGQLTFNVVSGLRKKELQESWERAKKGMNFALNFLSSNVGIDNDVLLTSPYMIISIANYASSKGFKLTNAEAQDLRYWALVANAKARYTHGSSGTLLGQDLAAIRRTAEISDLLKLLSGQVGELAVRPDELENRNKKSALFKTMFLAFRAMGARDWIDQLQISLNHSGLKHALQFHHIFPQSVLKKRNLPAKQINDICNLCFISGRANREISDKEPAVYLPDIVKKQGKEALEMQAIPTDSRLWRVEEYDSFLEERRKLVAKALNKFLGHDKVAKK